MSQQCYLCHSLSMRAFEPLGVQLSVTTDGQFIRLPLLKAQCTECGLVQTAQPFDKIFSHFSYQDNYAFYDRPNMRAFDAPRYRQYAQWVAGGFPEELANYSVLEVGCGAAWVLENLRMIHPEIQVRGIEPSLSASQAAKAAGIDIVQAEAHDPGLHAMHGQFDFVYSINVIEHTPDPVAFLRAMAKFVRPEGVVCVICPYGDLVNMDVLFLDHLYTIRKANLCHMFEIAGLKPEWSRGPTGFNEFQRVTGRLSDEAISIAAYACPATLFEMRDAHIQQWKALDGLLWERLEKHSEILCFGAGEISDLMKALAPHTWEKIVGHVVDPVEPARRNTAYRGKPLFYMDDPRLKRYDTALLGVKPHHQKVLYQRLGEKFAHAIRWDDLVESPGGDCL
jgi:SAM-dependent methyltransferase